MQPITTPNPKGNVSLNEYIMIKNIQINKICSNNTEYIEFVIFSDNYK